jgi:hypothetical protein
MQPNRNWAPTRTVLIVKHATFKMQNGENMWDPYSQCLKGQLDPHSAKNMHTQKTLYVKNITCLQKLK